MMNQNEAHRSHQHADPGGDEPGQEEVTGVSPVNPKEVLGMVEGFARENPHAALAGACALGFLLGGGLTPRLLSTIAVIAGRRYLNQSIRGTLENVLREQLGGRQEA